jgi:pantothenate kinase type III
MIAALIVAKTEEETETAYRNLEKVGVDRWTALLLAREMLEE